MSQILKGGIHYTSGRDKSIRLCGAREHRLWSRHLVIKTL